MLKDYFKKSVSILSKIVINATLCTKKIILFGAYLCKKNRADVFRTL